MIAQHSPGYRRTDPDETEGRLMYRAHADAMARASFPLPRKIKLAPEPPHAD